VAYHSIIKRKKERQPPSCEAQGKKRKGIDCRGRQEEGGEKKSKSYSNYVRGQQGESYKLLF